MSFSKDEEERENYESFMEHVSALKQELEEVKDKASVSLLWSKDALLRMKKRIEYMLEEYND